MSALQITTLEAAIIAKKLYGVIGTAHSLEGYEESNFRIEGKHRSFVLKFSDSTTDSSYLSFQTSILNYLEKNGNAYPHMISDLNGHPYSTVEISGRYVFVRMLSWVDGVMWGKLHYRQSSTYCDYGELLARMVRALQGFDHAYAHRQFNWDLNQWHWIKKDLPFLIKHVEYAEVVIHRMEELKPIYTQLRKQVIHNDANDYNVVTQGGRPYTLIDFGDAIHTQLINELAIGITYGCIDAADPLIAASEMVKGFNTINRLDENELHCLHTLIALRLVVSLTNSSINLREHPENTYHQISAGPARELLRTWMSLSPELVEAYFREACGMIPFRQQSKVLSYLQENKINLNEMLEKEGTWKYHWVDLGLDSSLISDPQVYHDPYRMDKALQVFSSNNKIDALYGGYEECRPFYVTEAFRKNGINGPEYRTIHLGEDYWVSVGTKIIAPITGEIVMLYDNDYYKDYGPTIILRHIIDEHIAFYTLYGHLDRECLTRLKKGQLVEKGQWLAIIGKPEENGNWAPHLHFQIMLDLLGNENNFPGVWFPDEMKVWRHLCPDPKHLINIPAYPSSNQSYNINDILQKRTNVLGPSLSLSYKDPLLFLKGEGTYLINHKGQKYLDLVNNVAHVGHEHPEIVRAATQQINKLNTNTRYLHPEIIQYAEALLSTFSEKFTRVFFVNSGSEANELALRMARVVTGKKKIGALRYGYHGNTAATMDVSSYKFDGEGGKGCPESTFLFPMLDSIAYPHDSKDFFNGKIKEVLIMNQSTQIAGFIGESILSCGGQVVPPSSYLQAIYDSIHQLGGICIADEVQTGFARVGSCFWAFDLHNVQPDIVTMGKPIGNGHPLGAVVCTEEVAQAFANGMEYFNTYGGNPVSCAIGRVVLRVIKEDKLQENALELGSYFKGKLKNLQSTFPEIIGKISGEGLFLGITMENKNHEPLPDLAADIVTAMRLKRILLSTDGPFHNVIKIKPPLSIQMPDVDRVLDLLHNYLKIV